MYVLLHQNTLAAKLFLFIICGDLNSNEINIMIVFDKHNALTTI